MITECLMFCLLLSRHNLIEKYENKFHTFHFATRLKWLPMKLITDRKCLHISITLTLELLSLVSRTIKHFFFSFVLKNSLCLATKTHSLQTKTNFFNSFSYISSVSCTSSDKLFFFLRKPFHCNKYLLIYKTDID